MLWHFIVLMFLKKKNSYEALHNTTNALMQTLDIEGISKTAKEFSCDEDFNPNKSINYPRMDHIKKWNHTWFNGLPHNQTVIVHGSHIQLISSLNWGCY